MYQSLVEDAFAFRLVIALVFALSVAVVAVWVLLRKAKARRRALADAVEAVNLIGRGELDAALALESTDELARVVKDGVALIKERAFAGQYDGSLVDAMDASLIVVDHDGIIQTVNRATIRLLGYSADELVGQPFRVITDKYEKGGCGEAVRYLRKDGRSISVDFSSTELASHGAQQPGIVCVARDISEQNAVQDALKASEGKLNAILQAIGDLIIMVDKDLRIMWANEAVTDICGFDIIGKQCHAVLFNLMDICTGERCGAKKTFEDQLSHSSEIDVVVGEEPKVFECTTNVAMRDIDGAPNTVIEVCRDITGQRRTEQALVQNAKLASLGELGAGIAHELNSPLAGILSLAELMLRRMDSSDPNYLFVEKIKDAAVRSKHIIIDLMSYAGQGAQKQCSVSVNDVLRSVLSLFVSELKTTEVKIIEELALDLPEVLGNKGQLMEVFLNIIKNANHAIGDTGGGSGIITIKTSCFKADEKEFVMAEVVDNGPGMEDGVMQKIFDPFYTTREKGGGMNIGLGLSISKGIVEAHNARLEVESTPGAGACFKVTFPAFSQGSVVEATRTGNDNTGELEKA